MLGSVKIDLGEANVHVHGDIINRINLYFPDDWVVMFLKDTVLMQLYSWFLQIAVAEPSYV